MNQNLKDRLKSLNIDYTEHTSTGYLSDDSNLVNLIKTNVSKSKIILLVSPQGTGKTTLIKEHFHNAVCLYPTRMLTNQSDNQIKNTYYSIDTLMTWLNRVNFENYVLFIDEFHKIVQYASYAYQEQTSKMIELINQEKEKHTPMILTTATPDLIYNCLPDDLLSKIDTIIDIKTDSKAYISGLVFLQGYYSNQNNLINQKVIDLIASNYHRDNKQIALINNTKCCNAITKELNKMGINAVSLNSKNIESKENINTVNDIVTNGVFNADVLIATSWIDTGVSFQDTNISHVYCFIGKAWEAGDTTLINQFMARTRKSNPILFITKPEVTNTRYERLLFNQLINKSENLEDIDIEQEEANRIEQEPYKSNLYDAFYQTAKTQAEYYNNGMLDAPNNINSFGVIKQTNHNITIYQPSEMICKYLLYSLIETVRLSYIYKYMGLDKDPTGKFKQLLADTFNITPDRILINQTTLNKYVKKETKYRQNNKDFELHVIMTRVTDLIEIYAIKETKFKQQDLMNEINKIDTENTIKTVKSYFNNNYIEYPYEPKYKLHVPFSKKYKLVRHHNYYTVQKI